MMKFDLVIFDCDGVLLDSEIIACRVDAEAYTALGLPMTAEEIAERFAGMPDESVDAALVVELGRPLPPHFRDDIKKRVMEIYRTGVEPIAGSKTVLSSLRLPKCIASSASPAKLALGLIQTDLYELVYPHIFSTRLVPNGKPHPDIFLFAADKMGVPPSRSVVVEDSVAGVTAAKSAGMTCVGFVGGTHCAPQHSEKLKEAGADVVIDRLDALNSYVE